MPRQSTRPKSATSYKETRFGILPRSKVIALEKKGVKKALEYVLFLSEKSTAITPEIILSIHKVGFGDIFPDWAGRYRTIEVTVGNYTPPHHSQIPTLIQNLCNDLAERLKYLPSEKDKEAYLRTVIELLAWFQHRFIWIHPFQDYNGRVGRLLTNLITLNLGFPTLEIKADTQKDRDIYIDAMKTADTTNLSKLEDLLEKALTESLEKI